MPAHRRLPLALILLCLGATARAEPFVPTEDSLVVLRIDLPREQERLHPLERAVESNPADALAVEALAGTYLEIGRRSGEPRYFGRAEALLAPWLDRKPVPAALALQMADIWQYRHDYERALALIDQVLAHDRRQPRGLLMRATLHQTQGRFDAARADCHALLARGETALGTTCLAQVLSMTGSLTTAERLLAALVERSPQLPAGQRVWMLTALADVEERLGRADDAEGHLRQALELDAGDHYARLALADLLLDRGGAGEVVGLLARMPGTEGVLLRRAEAQRQSAPARPGSHAALLRARIEEAMQRGERVHRRDLVRLHLRVLGDERKALAFARDNWREQREPADARLLAEAALAARDPATLELLKEWCKRTGYEDRALERMLQAPGRES